MTPVHRIVSVRVSNDELRLYDALARAARVSRSTLFRRLLARAVPGYLAAFEQEDPDGYVAFAAEEAKERPEARD